VTRGRGILLRQHFYREEFPMTIINEGQFVFTKVIVADIERAFEFYNKVFGLVEIARISNGAGVTEMHEIIMGTAGSSGMPVPTLIVQRYPNKLLPSVEAIVLGFTVGNIEATIAAAVDAGASIQIPLSVHEAHGVKVVFLVDPQGIMIELLQYL